MEEVLKKHRIRLPNLQNALGTGREAAPRGRTLLLSVSAPLTRVVCDLGLFQLKLHREGVGPCFLAREVNVTAV